VITEHIFYNSHQIPTLGKHLVGTTDQSVYLDLSQNPEVLDAPHAIDIFDRLREIAPLKIVVNEYRKFYTPQKNFIYYPAFFHAYSHGTYLDPTSIVNFPKFAKKTKPEKILIIANKLDTAIEMANKVRAFTQQWPKWTGIDFSKEN
jgi:hypothetical protein